MAVEVRRGCGYRQVGGLYMVAGKLSAPCGRLPLELHVCPVCNQGIKQARSWQWINPAALLAQAPPCTFRPCSGCPLAAGALPTRAGLLWIGEQFYPTPEAFLTEARRLGVSRRIVAVPRDFKLGETWVLMAHPKAIYRKPSTDEERAEAGESPLIVRKGIITMFRPTAIEKLVTESQAKDPDAMEELAARGITAVVVPDDDPDHNPAAPKPNRDLQFGPRVVMDDEPWPPTVE